MNTDADAQDLADYLLGKYSEPEYRFEFFDCRIRGIYRLVIRQQYYHWR